MDKNRKIIISILVLLVLSAVLAIIDVSLNMQGTKREVYTLSSPGTGPGVGVLRVYGPISIAGSDSSILSVAEGSDAVITRLTEFESDSRIKAILLRINSPGGTVAATQEIFDKLMKLRKKNIVLVASMGEISASGGYYIASACNYIFANYGSITGSIGVIAVSPNLRGLFEKLGIKMNVIKSGRYKDILSAFREMSQEERELIQQMIDSSYQKFVKDVSLGRNIPIAEIEPYADGRVMNGEAAIKCKLVDELGSMEDAIKKAKILAKLPENAPVYDETKSTLEKILTSVNNMATGNLRIDEKMMMIQPLVEYRYQP